MGHEERRSSGRVALKIGSAGRAKLFVEAALHEITALSLLQFAVEFIFKVARGRQPRAQILVRSNHSLIHRQGSLIRKPMHKKLAGSAQRKQ